MFHKREHENSSNFKKSELIGDDVCVCWIVLNASDVPQIPPCIVDRSPDQSPGLGSHGYAKWSASNQDLPGETLIPECWHAGKNASLQPSVGTARWVSQLAKLVLIFIFQGLF